MAKLVASEAAQDVAVSAMRVLGEAGVTHAHTAERHYRDTPLMIIGEGTNEIQRTLIARQLVDRYGERPDALVARDGEPAERRLMVLAVRQFVEKRVIPTVGEHERAGRGPDDLVGDLADLGVLGAVVGAEQGGLGLDVTATAMIVEELARGWTAMAGAVARHLTVAFAIAWLAARSTREALLPPMTRGEHVGTAVFGSGVRARGDGAEWVLGGRTRLADNASRASLFLVAATSDEAGDCVALVERGMPGVHVGPVTSTLGQRGLDARSLTLDGARMRRDAVFADPHRRVFAFACILSVVGDEYFAIRDFAEE
ncbi:MAG: acyl-CoA dehydrogenase family protein [Candidatus Rokubacteria bacterium]|nr:acyl-CoA dehydrogenase family protein [Candidatus Rokubacteria bacterium]